MTTDSYNTITKAARRGSAILIVVGTLALIAVFAAIYISIGQSDQRVARSVESREDLEEIQNTIAEHILGVIGDDRLDTTTQHIDTGSGVFTVREVTDAPYTDWTMRSESSNQYELFNPSGRHALAGNPAASDYRVASDPYLASTSPTYLGNPGQQTLAATDFRPFGSLIHGNSAGVNEDSYIAGTYSSGFLDNRDWLQISNLAPDGRFVNLFNLRPNPAFGSGAIGGFDSEAGVGEFRRPSDGKRIRRMSEYLSLWRPRLGTGNNPVQSTELRAFDPAIEGIWLPGRNVPEMNHGIPANELANTPAVWTMYQRFMFQPINQPFITVNRNNEMSTWADPDYSVYQYADADGDGMADSRWFELTSAQRADRGGAAINEPRRDVERLYDAGEYRLFAAARVVDLSSMVNINTASDQIHKPEPENGAPLGITPGEVDLRRLLTMQDGATNYSTASFVGLSPSYFHRPRDSTLDDPNDEDFWHYRAYIDDPAASPKEILPSTMSLSTGRFAYSAIKRGQFEGTILDERYYAWPPEMRTDSGMIEWVDMNFNDKFNPPDGDYSDPTAGTNLYRLEQGSASSDAMDRKGLYNSYGRVNPFEPFIEGQSGQQVNGLYNENDLLELLMFHGLNDPTTISRLEKAAMGRIPSIFHRNQRSFSPLFSNRPLSLDRDRHGYVDSNGYNGSYAIRDLYPNFEREIKGSVAKESMAFFALTPRRLLTTVSGGAGIVPGVLIDSANPELLDDVEVPVSLQSALGSAPALFDMYSKSLAGELDPNKLPMTMNDLFVTNLSTARSDTTAGPAATLFYGHKGPELALRIAAHTAVNMKDLADGDTQNTVATLLIDNARRDEFGVTNFPAALDPGNQWYRDYPGVALGNLLDVGVNKLPGSQGGPGHFTSGEEYRQAVNVFGIEPMPVITEVASFYVFHDASNNAGGDEDFSPQRPRASPGGQVAPGVLPIPGAQTKITIDVDSAPGALGPDTMMHGIAFQLHNPFGVSISLGGQELSQSEAMMRQLDPLDSTQIDTNSNFQFDYYIEWNGYFFKLAEYQQYYPPAASSFDLRSLDGAAPILNVPNPADDFPVDGSALDPITYADYVARNVVLGPGETRVFYAMADPSFDVTNSQMSLDTKWTAAMNAYSELPGRFTDLTGEPLSDNDGLADGWDGRGWTGPAQEWIFQQFAGTGSAPIMVHPMDPRTGEYHDTTVKKYLTDAGTELAGVTGRQDPTEVRLWRKIVAPAEEIADFTPPETPRNLLHNDMLVDRMDLESGLESGLAEAIDGGEVADTASFPEDYPLTASEVAINARNDNTGFTVVKWAVTSRRDRDVADVLVPGAGQVREWMMSSRVNPASSVVNAVDPIMNLDGDPALTATDFIVDSGADLNNVLEPVGQIINGNAEFRTDFETSRNLAGLFATSDSVLVTMGVAPQDKNAIVDLAGLNGVGSATKFGRDASGLSRWIHPAGVTLHQMGDTARSNLRPDLFVSGSAIIDAPRLADLLLPWGIGPTYAPSGNGSLNENTIDPGYYPEEWMTLPEALAIALGYENPSLTNAADSIWNNAFTASERLLDNGHLALDNYVAYYNTDTAEAVPDFDVADDIRRGSGIPTALGVLGQARAIEPMDTTLTNEELLQTPTYGLININTAPIEVLRLLPGLSPSLTQFYPQNTNTTKESEWWPIDNAGLELPNLSTATTTPDVAASMVGYRDRNYVQPRGRSTNSLSQDFEPLNYTAAGALHPSVDNTSSHVRNLVTEVPVLNPSSDFDHRHRQTLSGIDGLRPTPGFESVGEVLAVTLSEDARGVLGLPLRFGYPQLDMQQYGTDTLNLDGISDTLTAFDPQLFGGNTNGVTVDDYAERLAMANGILNTISVRSDYFAVWFVVHAYQESDVANLTPQDPLVPSIAKRYVMVVDRTNVVDPGDTPRIVFLREVPM